MSAPRPPAPPRPQNATSRAIPGEPGPLRGRGAPDNPLNRFERLAVVPEPPDEPWPDDEGGGQGEPPRLPTELLRDTSRSIIARNDSPDIPFDVSFNPYRGCEHGCVYCLAGETPILMADGTSRPLREVRVGDAIYGTRRDGWYRRYVRTQVLAHWETSKPAYAVTLADGTRLVASSDHRFLTDRGWKYVSGAQQGARRRPHLTERSKMLGTGRFARAPVGDIEGAVLKSGARLEVLSVEPLGEQIPLFDITTGTGDFVADGIVSHNCYARPTHEYLGFSAGLDFETRILVKEDAPELLRRELTAPSWVPQMLALSGVTDPYQPVERRLRITRRCLEVLAELRHPVGVITKNRLVTRDLDLLAELARHRAAAVSLSVTTLDSELAARMEPRASHPRDRLRAIAEVAAAGVPVTVSVAPIIPGLNDHEIPAILEAAAAAGATGAGWVPLRLPGAVAGLFERWLEEHYPERKEKVLGRVRSLRGGRLNDPRFGSRMRGEGVWAEQIAALFAAARRRFGLDGPRPELSTAAFRRPGEQLGLFGSGPEG